MHPPDMSRFGSFGDALNRFVPNGLVVWAFFRNFAARIVHGNEGTCNQNT